MPTAARSSSTRSAISLNLQAKLLRVVENGVVERIGSNEPKKVDIRIIAATNRDVKAMMKQGTFRADLYHRLHCLDISLPPLRERESDILLLAAHFLELQVPAPLNERLSISRETAHLLLTYPWPGNVRELLHAVLSASIRTKAHINPEHLPDEISNYGRKTDPVKTLRQVEKEHIHAVLKAAEGNKMKAASMLGISRQTLYDKIAEYSIDLPEQTEA